MPLPASNVVQTLRQQPASDNISNHAENRPERKPRQQNTAGIQVFLQNSHEPKIEEYRKLRTNGRRQDSTKINEQDRIIAGQRSVLDNIQTTRSVNPRSKIILDNFIQKMVGAEQSFSTGNYINTSV